MITPEFPIKEKGGGGGGIGKRRLRRLRRLPEVKSKENFAKKLGRAPMFWVPSGLNHEAKYTQVSSEDNLYYLFGRRVSHLEACRLERKFKRSCQFPKKENDATIPFSD